MFKIRYIIILLLLFQGPLMLSNSFGKGEPNNALNIIKEKVKAELIKNNTGNCPEGSFDISLTLGRFPFSVKKLSTPSSMDFQITQADLLEDKKNFQGIIHWRANNGKSFVQNFSGSITHMTVVPVLKHPILPGQLISLSDLELKSFPISSISGKCALDMDDILGTTPRVRTLMPQKVIQLHEIKKPVLIQKGDTVQINYKTPNIQIQTQAIAQSMGIKGQTIQLLNISSKRIITAVVVDKNKAEISNPAF